MIPNKFHSPASAFENWPRNPKIAQFDRFPNFPSSLVWSQNYLFLSFKSTHQQSCKGHISKANFATKIHPLSVFVQKGSHNDSHPAGIDMVKYSQFGRFCKFGSFQPYLTHRQLEWSTMRFIEVLFLDYPLADMRIEDISLRLEFSSTKP